MSFKSVEKATVIATKQLEDQISRLNCGSNKNYWKVQSSQALDGTIQNHLQVDYKFKTFAKTWNFLNLVAYHASNVKHHPTIETTYNKVTIKLTTHDVGNKVTYNDLQFAQFIRDEFEREVEGPKKVVKMEELLKDARGQFSFSQASQIIDDLVSSNKEYTGSKDEKTKLSKKS